MTERRSPRSAVKRAFIAATGIALGLLLLSALLLLAGRWWLGGTFGFLGLTALVYDIHAAKRYRRRRQSATSPSSDPASLSAYDADS